MGRLKEAGLVRDPDHQTSIKAATHIINKLPRLQELVLQNLALHPEGVTDTELRSLLDARFGERPESTYRKRRSDLAKAGLAEETGARRDNGRGSLEKVWRLSDKGRALARQRGWVF